MNEPFFINVNDLEYKARFERWGYTHRFSVLIGEETVPFEPDEAGSYRALGAGQIATNVLQDIAGKLPALSDSIV